MRTMSVMPSSSTWPAAAPESAGWQLIGFTSAYDCEEVAPGHVKRVFEGAFCKVLVPEALEHAGYLLLGFWPGFDRELVAPGVVKRVYQAVNAQLLVPEDKVLRPDPKNLTPAAKALFELLFSD